MNKPNEMTVKFLVECDKHDGTGNRFKAGEVVSMNTASANHWIIRNLAAELVEEVKADDKTDDKTDANAAKAAKKKAKADAKAAKKAAKADKK